MSKLYVGLYVKINNHLQIVSLQVVTFANCDPDRIQTCDLQNRNLTFYSAELRGRKGECKFR